MNAVSRFCVPVSGSKSPHFSEIMGLGKSGAQERTRTFTAVKPLAPEASASTNSTTWAQNGLLRTGYAIVKLADCRPNPLYSIDTMAYRESAKSLRERSKFDPQELTLWHRIWTP